MLVHGTALPDSERTEAYFLLIFSSFLQGFIPMFVRMLFFLPVVSCFWFLFGRTVPPPFCMILSTDLRRFGAKKRIGGLKL